VISTVVRPRSVFLIPKPARGSRSGVAANERKDGEGRERERAAEKREGEREREREEERAPRSARKSNIA